jgi:Fe-S-cluster containining protein
MTDASGGDFVTISLELTIAGEKVHFDVSVPRGPATWEHLLPFMRALVKVGSDISQELFAARGKTISCRAGCGICCRQQVPIAPFEAHRLRRLVESMPEPRRSTLLARFRDAEERVKAAGLSELSSSGTATSIEEMVRRSGQYFRLMIPCPFLENESCSIYEERPLKCREYLVTSPAENCADPEQNNIEGLLLPLAVYMSTLFLEGDASRPGPNWTPLYRLLSWTDEQDQPEPSRTGPELLQEFMSRLMLRK